jgi:hypothetical protein
MSVIGSPIIIYEDNTACVTTIKTLCSIGCKVIFCIGQPNRYYSYDTKK